MHSELTFPLLAESGLSMAAPVLFHVFGIPVTNSMLIGLFVTVALIVFAQIATRNIQRVPSGAQNIWEWMIESLGGLLESILGHAVMQKTFWFFATIFIFILSCNLLALIPGIGTIGSGHYDEHGHFHMIKAWGRGANADVNMTGAIAFVFCVMWLIWSIQFNGLKGFLHHIFGSKAALGGLLGVVMVIIFFAVGILEVISIAVRPVALTFRLYGNIYGGEAMIHAIEHIAGNFAFLALIPVYLFELMVALVQALVFCLLTAVFTGMMCKHEEGHGHKEGHH
ncbi:MAG: F0F1 ATP synthase subunit A [Verrucomicrobiota bacterium]